MSQLGATSSDGSANEERGKFWFFFLFENYKQEGRPGFFFLSEVLILKNVEFLEKVLTQSSFFGFFGVHLIVKF